MSHHCDSLLAHHDPRWHIGDVSLFRGTVATVVVMNVDSLSGVNE